MPNKVVVDVKRPYERPQVTRVQLDPVRELMSGCIKFDAGGDPDCTGGTGGS